MRTVAANAHILIHYNRSMAVALEKAENGEYVDLYYIENLRKSAAVLGYSLTLCKETKTPETARAGNVCLGCGEPKKPGLLIVCWNCMKHRKDITPLKYFDGEFEDWLKHVEQAQ